MSRGSNRFRRMDPRTNMSGPSFNRGCQTWVNPHSIYIRLPRSIFLSSHHHHHHQTDTMSDSDPPTTPTPITFGRSFIRPDIELVIWDVVYHVHSFTLRGSSKFFDASLSERWAHEEVHERPDSIKYVYAISNSYDDKDPAALHTLERIPRNKQVSVYN